MSSPTLTPESLPPGAPPRPADFTNGAIGSATYDHSISSTVLVYTSPKEDTFTISVTEGSAFFSLLTAIVTQLTLKNVNAGTALHALWVWESKIVSQSNGQAPVKVAAGEIFNLAVAFEAKLNSTLPGAVAGTLVAQGMATGARTVALSATYIGVNPKSPIGQKWTGEGGEAVLGSAHDNESPAPNGNGTVQEFDKGAIWTWIDNGLRRTVYLKAAVWNKYKSWSTATDAFGTPLWNVLGNPIEDSFATNESGQAVRFSGPAIIVARPTSQAFVVHGAIYAKYSEFGDLSVPNLQPAMGYPTSDEVNVGSDASLRVNQFDTGVIYWSQAAGALEIHGAIWALWKTFPVLGFPTTDEMGTPDGIGRYNRFEGGVVYWTSTLGAHEVQGAILQRWAALGYEKSYLGYPVSNEQDWNQQPFGSGRVSNFQFGQIVWVQSSNQVIEFPAQVQRSAAVDTPDGTALGGAVTVTLKANGDYVFQCNMHDSGLPGYQFIVNAVWTTPGGLAFTFTHHGSVQGSESISPNRDDNYTETGNKPVIGQNWGDVQGGRLWITRDYSATGLAGFVQDLAQGLLDDTATAATGLLGVLYTVGKEVDQVFGLQGLGATFGIVAGVVIFAFTGGYGLALVAGVIIGKVTEQDIQQRALHADEVQLAENIFGGTLKSLASLRITNLILRQRPFTFPGTDGITYLNMGDGGFANGITYHPNSAYQTDGQVLVHELTHAWQIIHSKFLPLFICNAIVTAANYEVGEDVYQYGPPTCNWSDFGPESQAAIVDQWFAGIPTVNVPNRTPKATGDPYYRYILNNIQKGMD